MMCRLLENGEEDPQKHGTATVQENEKSVLEITTESLSLTDFQNTKKE